MLNGHYRHRVHQAIPDPEDLSFHVKFYNRISFWACYGKRQMLKVLFTSVISTYINYRQNQSCLIISGREIKLTTRSINSNPNSQAFLFSWVDRRYSLSNSIPLFISRFEKEISKLENFTFIKT